VQHPQSHYLNGALTGFGAQGVGHGTMRTYPRLAREARGRVQPLLGRISCEAIEATERLRHRRLRNEGPVAAPAYEQPSRTSASIA